jgi:hypothetical protein
LELGQRWRDDGNIIENAGLVCQGPTWWLQRLNFLKTSASMGQELHIVTRVTLRILVFYICLFLSDKRSNRMLWDIFMEDLILYVWNQPAKDRNSLPWEAESESESGSVGVTLWMGQGLGLCSPTWTTC